MGTLRSGIYLKEGSVFGLFLGHTLDDQLGLFVDAGNESVSEGLVGGSLVVRLDNKGFASCKASTKDQDNLALFHNLAHFEEVLVFSSRVFSSTIREEKEVFEVCFEFLDRSYGKIR